MRTDARRGALLALALALAACLGPVSAVPARAAEAKAAVPTNSDLLTRALRAAADSAFHNLPLRRDATVVLVPAPGQSTEWAVENQLAETIKGRVAKLTFRSGTMAASADTSAAAAGAASAPDSVPLLQRMAAAAKRVQAPPKTGAQMLADDPTAHALEYRLAALTITYEGLRRSRLLGPGMVERVAVAELGIRYLDAHGELLGSGSGSATVRDEIPQLRLPEVEDRLYQTTRPTLPSRNLTRIIEPAIVIGLVRGLIFLYSTNRN
jgi:hypothetical protein